MWWRERYEWLIGLRYLRAKRSESFISVITFLSLGGVALGVAALITVLAVMTGFREELQGNILGVTSHVTVRAANGNLAGHEKVMETIAQDPRVTALAPFVSTQAMLSVENRSAAVALRGIEPEREAQVSSLATNVKEGKLAGLPEFGILLGKRLARNLYLEVGDGVTVTVSTTTVTAMGTLPRMKRFIVVGIFDSGMYEYDHALAYIRLEDAQRLNRLGADISGIAVMTTTPQEALGVGKRLKASLGSGYEVQDWMEMNRSFFRALQLEKATMSIILLLVVLVAAFNIVSSLVMVVMEKGKEIAILKSMGARRRGVMAIFIINGGTIGILGTVLGTTLGVLLAKNLESVLRGIENLSGIQLVSGDAFFQNHVPSTVLPSDVAWIAGMSLTITLLATLYPAWRAAGVDPVEALRYE
ncbi:Lipoprotein-releasing system permease protein [Candidatus Magnetaquicoccaceae bacterium FCR-1]|uniref:Lipoprotein-releasing system permease protein n=1 Tax=Candidatus Magnetaquiglobus chichijimensis TaxID=3141448 RepID=A0ABQ0C7E6_9PROT